MEIHHMTPTQSEQRITNSVQRRFGLFWNICSLLALRSALLAAVNDGYVVKMDSSTIYLDWSAASGIKAGDAFQTYKPGEELKHPVTGQVLGQTKTVTGSGYVTDVLENFSLGQVLDRQQEGPRAGQRVTRLDAVRPPAQPLPAATPGAMTLLRERWRSVPFKGEMVGLASGDLDGDGKKELVVAFRDRLEVMRWNGEKLETTATHKDRSDRGWVTVDVFDVGGAGRDLIFAGCVPPYPGARGKTVVLAFQDGTLKEVARGDGFVRRVEHAEGKPTLMWQGLSMSQHVRVQAPSTVVIEGKKLKPGHPYPLVRPLNDDQLLGLTFGDWNADGQEDMALLQGGERLRLFFSSKGGGKDAPFNWSAPEIYGGTKSLITLQGDTVAWVFPRLMTRAPVKGPAELWVPRNVPKLGIRTTYMKFFDRSELVALAWNGLEMAALWRVPVEAYLADFTVGDLNGTGVSQLWMATHAPGNKSVLLAFDLP